ncbi:MAG: alpha/beta hydrolase [Propionibacteriaceae bacterium]|nr:alpha/beta hydrolase [Propionibacteriaceae bacterium]
MKQYPVKEVSLPNGETLAYRQCGTASQTIVLLHGNRASSVHWQTTMEVLEDEFTVYAIDSRGCGDSTYNHAIDTVHELAEDMEAFIDILQIPPFSLVGWSTGGAVAMEVAADRPDLVLQLILVESVPPTGYRLYAVDDRGTPLLNRPLKTKEEIAAHMSHVSPVLGALAQGNLDSLQGIWGAFVKTIRHTSDPTEGLYMEAMLKQRNMVDANHAVINFNISSRPSLVAAGSRRMDKIMCPVSIIHGAKDTWIPIEWAYQTKELFGERATMEVFPEGGHSPMVDLPDQFIPALLNALHRLWVSSDWMWNPA